MNLLCALSEALDLLALSNALNCGCKICILRDHFSTMFANSTAQRRKDVIKTIKIQLEYKES